MHCWTVETLYIYIRVAEWNVGLFTWKLEVVILHNDVLSGDIKPKKKTLSISIILNICIISFVLNEDFDLRANKCLL